MGGGQALIPLDRLLSRPCFFVFAPDDFVKQKLWDIADNLIQQAISGCIFQGSHGIDTGDEKG
jgi:hypothetical protein